MTLEFMIKRSGRGASREVRQLSAAFRIGHKSTEIRIHGTNFMAQPIAWLNGRQLAFDQMALPVWDLGVVAGASISEMARTYGHVPFRLKEHVQRLVDSCEELGLELPYDHLSLTATATELVVANCKLLDQSDDLGIVWFVTAGSNATYLAEGTVPGPSVGIHTFRLPFHLWKAAATEGVRLRIPHVRQISNSVFPVHRKVRNRLHWWLADRAVGANSSGCRALLLDDDGFLTETSTSAFFGVVDGTILSPRRNVLDSMSRRLVQEAAKELGLRFELADLPASAIQKMDEVFLSSTPVGLLPVQSIDGTAFPVNHPDSVLDQLLGWWTPNTGLNPLQQVLERC